MEKPPSLAERGREGIRAQDVLGVRTVEHTSLTAEGRRILQEQGAINTQIFASFAVQGADPVTHSYTQKEEKESLADRGRRGITAADVLRPRPAHHYSESLTAEQLQEIQAAAVQAFASLAIGPGPMQQPKK